MPGVPHFLCPLPVPTVDILHHFSMYLADKILALNQNGWLSRLVACGLSSFRCCGMERRVRRNLARISEESYLKPYQVWMLFKTLYS